MEEVPSCYTYLLPSHPSVVTEDPLSICESYESGTVPLWLLITKLLQQPVTNVKELTNIISSLNHDAKFGTLHLVLQKIDFHHFITTSWPAMCKVGLSMPELFPSGELNVLHPGVESVVSLNRKQIACLLVHMFLCTLNLPVWNKYWVDFSIWYNSTSPPVTAYLLSLFEYFGQLDATGSPPNSNELVIFRRRVLASPLLWSSSNQELSQITPSCSFEPGSRTEVDFANKDVSFGVSGSQEEAKLAASPETCVVVLLAPTLQNNETLLILGAREVAKFEGIGRQVKFVGRQAYEEKDWSSRAIIAMNALELDVEETDVQDTVIPELRQEYLDRELNKAYCGFQPIVGDKPFPSIDTGHWGCGAFGGHKYTKALIQVMAASEAGTKLIFHDIPPTSDFLQNLMDFISLLIQKRVTVGQVYSAMLEAGRFIAGNKLQEYDILSLLRCNLLSID